MSALLAAESTAQLCAALLAVPAARRERAYRPVAVFLWATTGASWASAALSPLLVFPSPPREGVPRLALEVSHALFLGWPAAVAALLFVVFLRRRTWPVTVVWAATIGNLTGTYPWLHSEVLTHRIYGAATASACVVGAIALSRFLRRGLHLGPEHLASILILASTGGIVLGPCLDNALARSDFASWAFLGLYLALSSIGAWQWIRSYSTCPSPSPPPVLH